MTSTVHTTPILENEQQWELTTRLFVSILRKISQVDTLDQLRNVSLALKGRPYSEYFFFGFADSYFWVKQKGYPNRILISVNFNGHD